MNLTEAYKRCVGCCMQRKEICQKYNKPICDIEICTYKRVKQAMEEASK